MSCQKKSLCESFCKNLHIYILYDEETPAYNIVTLTAVIVSCTWQVKNDDTNMSSSITVKCELKSFFLNSRFIYRFVIFLRALDHISQAFSVNGLCIGIIT